MRIKEFFFIGIILALISLSVNASSPSVDFNFTPTSPTTGQSIIFDPAISSNNGYKNIDWQFGTDGNVHYGPGLNTILDENFNVDFTGWNVEFGSFSIVSNQLKSSSTQDSTLSHPLTYDNNSVFQVNMRMGTTIQGGSYTCWNEATIAGGGGCGSYNIALNLGNGNIRFQKAFTNLFTIQAFTSGTMYDINVFRASDGNWSFYVDGVYKGSIVDTSDPIVGGYFVTAYLASAIGFGNWDSIKLITGTDLNADINETHSFSTQGTKNICLTAGNQDGNTTTCHSLSVSTANATPDINILYPQNHEVFDKNTVSAIDINFLVHDPDNNSLLVDLNYSSSTSQGTGTPIITDTNTLTLTCSTQNLAGTANCTYHFVITGVTDGNYFILGRAKDNALSDFDAGDLNFRIQTTSVPPSSPNVTIISPNGGEGYNKNTVHIVEINFDILDSDSNSWKIDLNYSTTGIQGSGTIITNDLNTLAAGIICSHISGGQNCTVDWNIDGVAVGNYYADVRVKDGYSTPDFDSSDSTFSIIFSAASDLVTVRNYVDPEDPRAGLPFDHALYVDPLDSRIRIKAWNAFMGLMP